jgi:hypothetical protein
MPAVDVTIDCEGRRHTLVWERGRLVPLHHENPDGERLLLALGGEARGCLAVISTWDDHVRDLRLLATGPRGVADQISLRSADVAEVGRHLALIAAGHPAHWPQLAAQRLGGVGVAQRGPVAFRSLGMVAGVMASGAAGWNRHVGLLELYTWPRFFLDRLLLEAWATRSADLRAAAASLAAGAQGSGGRYRRERPVLMASALARVRSAVITWLAVSSQDPQPQVTVELSGDGAPLRIAGSVVSAGADWVAAVSGRQMGVVDGHLVTEILDLSETTAQVRALTPPTAGGAPVRVRLVRSSARDGWELA